MEKLQSRVRTYCKWRHNTSQLQLQSNSGSDVHMSIALESRQLNLQYDSYPNFQSFRKGVASSAKIEQA